MDLLDLRNGYIPDLILKATGNVSTYNSTLGSTSPCYRCWVWSSQQTRPISTGQLNTQKVEKTPFSGPYP